MHLDGRVPKIIRYTEITFGQHANFYSSILGHESFHVHVDASSISLGILLVQPGEGEIDHPILFVSCKLYDVENNYTITKREGLAMIYAL